MRGVLFNSDAESRGWLDKFFELKSNDFYQKDIENLVKHWEKL